MSFVVQDDVFRVVETLMSGLFQEFAPKKQMDHFLSRIAYNDAMLQYGTDKPDLRNPIRIVDLTQLFQRQARFAPSPVNLFALFVYQRGPRDPGHSSIGSKKTLKPLVRKDWPGC